MPPKTSAKAIAAEIKKKNTAEANDIVATMKLTALKNKPSRETASKTAIMERLFGSSTVEMAKTGSSDAVANPPKKPEKEVVLKRKARKDTAAIAKTSSESISTLDTSHIRTPPKKPEKEVVLKQNARKDTVAIAKTSSESISDEPGVVGMDIDLTGLSSSGIEREKALPEMPNTRKFFERKVDQIATRLKGSDKGNSSKPKSSTKQTKSGHGAGYQYEIDCLKVSDSINVTDLKRYLETQLKVNGHKNNFGSTVTISCEGQKVVIKSKVFLPKKSLRFLSKKFLKKNWNIRVASKNVHSYEYKYVGIL